MRNHRQNRIDSLVAPSTPSTPILNPLLPAQAPGTTPAEEIAVRAYYLYEKAGRPDGQDLDHWLQAETEATQEHRT